MENKVRISVVSYLNSTPFVKGLVNSPYKDLYQLSIDIPSLCAEKLLNDEVDIGLIPVAMISSIKESYILGKYCIAANGKVASVLIISNDPIENLTSIILDNESRTSVMLAKILATKYWKIVPEWVEEKGYNLTNLPSNTGAVIIGNRALANKSGFKYCYDLADVWKTYTGLPFVFACWVANKKIDIQFEMKLNQIFEEGLLQREKLIIELKDQFPNVNIREYLFENINYDFTENAQMGMNLFLKLLKEVN